MPDILVVGGGFAGLWASLAAVREFEAAGAAANVTLVSVDPYLVLRPRLYEAEPERMRVDLRPTLQPAGVRLLTATATGVDVARQRLMLADSAIPYDRLVLAVGSVLPRPDVDGAEHMFDIDSYGGAVRLDRHLRALAGRPDTAARNVVVLGGGFTGIELATELRTRLSGLWGPDGATARVILLEAADCVGPALGEGPRAAIQSALDDARVELRLNTRLRRVMADGAELSDGTHIATATVIMTTGMRAHPLGATLAGATRDELGRLHVDRTLRVQGAPGVFAAGDIAHALTDETHLALMSCQHALSMGRAAGRNVARDLLGLPMAPYEAPDYVTCLDLGAWGAVFTRGWDRKVQMSGAEAKTLKRQINTARIYPPQGGRDEILAAVTPPPRPGQSR